MMRYNKINSVMCLMGFVIFLAIIKADQEALTIKIKNYDEIIELNFLPKDPILANQHLPIWIALKNKTPFLKPNVMTQVGEFVMYQDIQKTSAIVYMKKLKTIYGVIDTRFLITGLPFDQLRPNIYHAVGGNHIIALKNRSEKKHLQPTYDDLLSVLLTHEEIEYVNSIIDQTDPELNAKLFTSTPNTNNNEHQHVFQNNEATRQTTSNFFYPEMSTDNMLKYFVNTPNDNLDIFGPVAEALKADEDENNETQKAAKDYRQSPNILYPEILLFVTHDVFCKHINLDTPEGISALIHQYLIYFNAIDMMFAKLASDGILIHINIAGIVLEAEPGTFPYTFVQGTSDKIDVVETMYNLPQYIRQHRRVFSEDLFDYFLLSTSYTLLRENEKVAGVARTPFEIYENRAKNKPFDQILGVTIQHLRALSSYIGSTHEIAHLMNISHDPSHDIFKCIKTNTNFGICNAIMQERDGYCQQCAVWSEKSISEFKEFISTNRNRCFLLNYPRSLNPYDYPMPMISLHDQCLCYGFDQSTLDSLRLPNSCNKPMNCGHRRIDQAILPLDGTPCNLLKVCWKKECLNVGQPATYNKEKKIKEKRLPKSFAQKNTCQLFMAA